jgi:hypothetical protein
MNIDVYNAQVVVIVMTGWCAKTNKYPKLKEYVQNWKHKVYNDA